MTSRQTALAVPGDLSTLTGGYIYDRRLLHELRSLGHDVLHIELPSSFPNPTPVDMAESFRLLQAVKHDCPIIIDGLAFGALDTSGVKKLPMPLIALIHHPLAKESGLSHERQRVLYETERSNLENAAHVIVPSPHTAEILIAEYAVAKAKITIARPGTDRPEQPLRRINPPLILSVGIQLPRKGHDILLKALAMIVDLDWQAIIVGSALDKKYAQDLLSLRASLELEKRVTFAGQIDSTALSQLYRSAGLFALATRFEGYGIVFDEALVHGLPIVSCQTGAVPDTVPSSAGLLVPAGQPGAFADALRKLLSDSNVQTKLAKAALDAGHGLPGWVDTAQITSTALSAIKSC